jgi:hypothetical protein
MFEFADFEANPTSLMLFLKGVTCVILGSFFYTYVRKQEMEERDRQKVLRFASLA